MFVSYVWVLFVVMCVVGGVPLLVECVLRRVDVCLYLLYTQLLFECGVLCYL